jgi:hypothetical protein
MNTIDADVICCPEIEEMFSGNFSTRKFFKIVSLPPNCKILNIYVDRHDTNHIVFSYLCKAKNKKFVPVAIEFARPGAEIAEDSEFIGMVDVSRDVHFRTFLHCFIVKK